MKPGERATSLSTRVMIVTATSAVLGGALAASSAMLALDALVQEHGDQRLLAATDTLAGELDEDRKKAGVEMLVEVLEDENEEIITSGIRLAVYEDGRLVAGDAWAKLAGHEGCDTLGRFGNRIRSCSRPYQSFRLVAAQRSDQRELRAQFVLAGLGALVVGAGLAMLAARALSRWAVRPLLQLSTRLEHSDPRAPLPLQLGSSSDCQEVLAIERALDDLMRRVTALLSHAQRFAADAAHELRTPLAALRIELELLLEDQVSEQAKATIASSLGRIDALTSLLERLLLLASPTAELARGFETVALSDLVQELVASLPEAERARISVHTEDEGLLRGDPTLLRALVGNALGNARKFAGDSPVQVNVRSERGVQLEVIDEGPGVPAELRQRVFEPFYRRHPNTKDGSGLGLALIGHIAEAHGARAGFVQRERGAHLQIVFPRWTQASGEPHGQGRTA